MLSLCVSDENVKMFMNRLLKEDTFDAFESRSVIISTFARFEISEEKQASDDGNPTRLISCWRDIKPFVLTVIKGRQKPSYIKAVFSLDASKTAAVSSNASALFLNIVFDGERITVTTGVSQKDFTLDKSTFALWDDYVTRFLTDSGINFTSQI